MICCMYAILSIKYVIQFPIINEEMDAIATSWPCQQERAGENGGEGNRIEKGRRPPYDHGPKLYTCYQLKVLLEYVFITY